MSKSMIFEEYSGFKVVDRFGWNALTPAKGICFNQKADARRAIDEYNQSQPAPRTFIITQVQYCRTMFPDKTFFGENRSERFVEMYPPTVESEE